MSYNFTTAITALDTKIQALTSSATAHDTAYLSAAIEKLNPSTSVAAVLTQGDTSVAAVAAQGTTSIAAVTAAQTAATTALNSLAYPNPTTGGTRTIANNEFALVTSATQTISLPEAIAGQAVVYIGVGDFLDTLVKAHGAVETVTKAVTVVNSGGNKFALDGTTNPAITLNRGSTYIFDVSHSSNAGHPLVFKNADDSAYTTGVTVTGTAGSSGAKVTIVVAADAPSTLKYSCSVHGTGMGNAITVEDQQKIMGLAQNLTIDRKNTTLRCFYTNAAQGWRIF